MSLPLSGQAAFVTGGTSGLGRACALALRDAGALVYVGSSNAAKVSSTVAELNRTGVYAPRVPPSTPPTLTHGGIVLDVASAASVETAFAGLGACLPNGRLDILVCAAGILRRSKPEEEQLSDWNEIIAVNLTGAWLCNKAAFRLMQGGGGRAGRVAPRPSLILHLWRRTRACRA